MEIITKLDRVWESSSCPGCGSVLGLKFLLQTIENLENVILVTAPGEISLLSGAGLKVNVVNSRNPAATARGLAASQKDKIVIVYAGDGFTEMNLPSLLDVRENILYVCYNNFGHSLLNNMRPVELAPCLIRKAGYIATASVSYYEDFVGKIKKSLGMPGFRFIELMAPCPALWKYEPSNTIEIGRMATESHTWPLYEMVMNSPVSVTKVPSRTETFQRFIDAVKVKLPEADVQKQQDVITKRWKALNEGRFA